MANIYINTSWDDGHSCDLRLAEMLAKYGIPAIFFVPATNPERDVIGKKDIASLSKNFEIGSHTYSHVYLDKLSITDVEKEILNGKKYIEDITSVEARHFCYPGGKYNKQIQNIALTYCESVRTADIMNVDINCSSIRPTIHLAYRSKRSLFKQILLFAPLELKTKLLRKTLSGYKIQELFEIYLECLAQKKDGNFMIHLWGHSWEIDALDLWEEAEDVFKTLSSSGYLHSYSDMVSDAKFAV